MSAAKELPGASPGGDPAALLAHARHELRTPINAIIGYSEMMLEDADQLGQNDLSASLQEINLLGRTLLDGVNQLFQMPAAGRLDAEELVQRARERLGPSCGRVLECGQALLDQTRGHKSLSGFVSDLERILMAALRFQELLHGPLDMSAPASAPALPASAGPIETTTEREHAALIAPEFWEQARGHVLVVDDNKFNRDMLARGLIRQNLHFALAGNGKQALDMLASGAFDLVLLDILMPEMDGFEVLARIKENPALAHVPVIMISALDQIDSVVRCIEMGAEDYLPKPFDPVLLKARVGASLEKKRLRDQELEYLRSVKVLTEAAAAVEGGVFEPNSIDKVALRTDPLGQLARVFQSMAREVAARVQRLQMQVQQLKVEIDEARKTKQVAEITDTGYFQQLQEKAQHLRKRRTGE